MAEIWADILQVLDWTFAAKLLQAIGVGVTLLGLGFGLLRIQLSFGLSAIWTWLDRSRAGGYLGHAIAGASSNILVAIAITIWVIVGLGVIGCAFFPNVLFDQLPNAGEVIEARALAAIAALTRPFAVAVAVVLVVSLSIWIWDSFFTRFTSADVDDFLEAWVSKPALATIAWSLIPLCLWALVEVARWAPAVLGDTLPDLIAAYLDAYGTVQVLEAILFLLTATSLAALPLLIVGVVPLALWLAPVALHSVLREGLHDQLIGKQLRKPENAGKSRSDLRWSSEIHEALREYDRKSLLSKVPEPGAVVGRTFFGAAILVAGLFASVSLSYSASVTGAHFAPDSDIQLSLQVLAANGIFDGITLAGTIAVLGWASESARLQRAALQLRSDSTVKEYTAFEAFSAVYRRDRALRKFVGDIRYADTWYDTPPEAREAFRRDRPRMVPFMESEASKRSWQLFPAMGMDLLLACVLAYGALFAAFFGTPYQLDIFGLNRAFIAGWDGVRFTELGPMFWLMHTTFIPTLIYWAILVAAATAGWLVSPLVNYVLKPRLKEGVEEASKTAVKLARAALVKTGGFIGLVGGAIHALIFLGWLPPGAA